MGHQGLSDEDVVQIVQDGNTEAFSTLVERYHERVFNTACRMVGYGDAADLTQDIFYKAFRGLGGFRQASTFSTWIYRIALNTANSHRRKFVRDRQVFLYMGAAGGDEDAPAFEPASDDPPPPARAIRREEIEAVRAAIAELDETDQEIILLREMEQRSYDEISEILGVALGTVKSRLFRARAALKEKLAGTIAPAETEG